jgi:hypothetical protein
MPTIGKKILKRVLDLKDPIDKKIFDEVMEGNLKINITPTCCPHCGFPMNTKNESKKYFEGDETNGR